MWRRGLTSASATSLAERLALRLTLRGVADRVNGVAPALKFRRLCEAPTMEPDAVVATLRELVAERSADVPLFGALSQRFHARAEEFFPLQIDRLLGCFAELGYADESLAEGVAGRVGDLMSDASPRRVVRVLRNAAALRLPHEVWLDAATTQLHRHLPNLRDGVPSVLESLGALRWRDEELAELLLTQGLLIVDGLHTGGRMNSDRDGYLARLFERWSRIGFNHAEVEGLAVDLARTKATSLDFDVRDTINLLAGLRRCAGDGAREACRELEAAFIDRLRAAKAEDTAMVAAALAWMERLSFCSPALWQACADAVELALADASFVRDHLPVALQSLAALLGSPAEGQRSDSVAKGGSPDGEVALLGSLLGSAQLRAALPRYSASARLRILRAAGLAAAHCRERGGSDAEASLRSSTPWELLAQPVARTVRQLTLPERRLLWPVAEVLEDFTAPLKPGSAARAAASAPVPERAETSVLGELGALRLAPLPALAASGVAALDPQQEQLRPLQVGSEHLLRAGGDGAKAAVKFLGPGDIFATPSAAAAAGLRQCLTPTSLVSLRAAELQGWKMDLRI